MRHRPCSGAQVALTNNAYNWAKKVAGIKKSFSKSKQEWPDVQWILTDGKLPVKPGEAAGADSAGRGQRLGSDYLDMKGMEEVEEEEVKSLLGNGVHVMSLY